LGSIPEDYPSAEARTGTVLARLTTGGADPATLAAELRLSIPSVNRNLGLLVAAGLVEPRDKPAGSYAARLDRLGELAKSLATLEAHLAGTASGPDGAWPHEGESLVETLARLDLTPEEAKTLRSYLVDGRLATIPAQVRKRTVVLRFLLERVFTEDREYPEKEVNQRLALFHPDVASLRRYLVDQWLVTREAGWYRRARA
jgi:hypothetical protein